MSDGSFGSRTTTRHWFLTIWICRSSLQTQIQKRSVGGKKREDERGEEKGLFLSFPRRESVRHRVVVHDQCVPLGHRAGSRDNDVSSHIIAPQGIFDAFLPVQLQSRRRRFEYTAIFATDRRRRGELVHRTYAVQFRGISTPLLLKQWTAREAMNYDTVEQIKTIVSLVFGIVHQVMLYPLDTWWDVPFPQVHHLIFVEKNVLSICK